MHPENVRLDADRQVTVSYEDEIDRPQHRQVIPHGLTFVRGSWWLEATDVTTTNLVRIRLTHIRSVTKY